MASFQRKGTEEQAGKHDAVLSRKGCAGEGAFEKAGAKKVAETVEIENNAEEEDIELLKTFVKSVATTLSDSVA